ncbi:MAG: tyrosine-type recombinase/integrase [Candidatus Dormibacteria bacterium]
MTSPRRPTAPARPRLPAWAAQIPGPTDTLPDQIQQYLDHLRVQRNRPLTTVRAYRQDLAKFVAFMRTRPARATLCDGLDRETLRRYQVELADVLPHPRTRARALVALRRFLSYAYDEGWTATELSRQVAVPRYAIGDPHPVPTENVPALLAALPTQTLRDLRDRALISLLVATGCRIAEACALDRGDVRPDGFRVLGKGGKHRTVYLTDAAAAAVADYLERRGPDPSPALFISVAHADMPRGRALPHNRLTTDGARHALRALRRRFSADPRLFALIADLRTPHVARHTAATTLLEATDGDVRLVQEVLGHATLETLRVYTEITDKRKRAAYARLGEYLEEVAAEV